MHTLCAWGFSQPMCISIPEQRRRNEGAMEYEFIPPSYLHPVVFGFYHLNRRAARAYFTWFLEQLSRRIELVEHAVRASPEADYQAWQADGRVESLTVLGRWFADHVHVRPRTAEEI